MRKRSIQVPRPEWRADFDAFCAAQRARIQRETDRIAPREAMRIRKGAPSVAADIVPDYEGITVKGWTAKP